MTKPYIGICDECHHERRLTLTIEETRDGPDERWLCGVCRDDPEPTKIYAIQLTRSRHEHACIEIEAYDPSEANAIVHEMDDNGNLEHLDWAPSTDNSSIAELTDDSINLIRDGDKEIITKYAAGNTQLYIKNPDGTLTPYQEPEPK